MLKTINGATLRKMIIAGASCVEESKKAIDALNVFPVPDGDTGTNMALTLKSTANEVYNCSSNNLEDVSVAISKGALKGARGNSGVILSQILKGLATILGKETNITTKVFAKALKEGSDVAYKAVTKPKEGTMLTVIRVMAEAAQSVAKKVSDFEEFFQIVLTEGENILQKTPDMLPVLKKAGVVDSGGRGIIVFFTGVSRALSDDTTFEYNFADSVQKSEDEEFHANLDALDEIQFAYCTEFMVIQMKPKTTESDIDKLRERLLNIGDCVLCIGDLSLVKVHVHTNEPNKALGFALELGEIYNIKIENMLEQNRAMKNASSVMPNLKPYGMVAISPGNGISDVFKELLVDNIVSGGQTMNPSAEDIANAVMKVNAKDIFVFPNNKNIILAAEQAKGLIEGGRSLHVIPTKSIPEGVSACLSFNPDSNLNDNLDALKNSFTKVKSGSVTYAVRTTHVDGFDLSEGEIIGLDNKQILAKSDDINTATKELISKMIDDDIVNITLFYGADVTTDSAEKLKLELEDMYPYCDINLIQGGQPVYYYIISLE